MKIGKRITGKYFAAFQRLVGIRRFADTRFEGFSAWFEGPGKPHVMAFRNVVDALPQAKLILDDDVLAWIWSFHNDPSMKMLPEAERRRYLIGSCAGLRKLSAYDAGIVAQEIDAPDSWNFAFKSAESIRRGVLLRDLYAPVPARPETRLRSFARQAMIREAWRAVHEASRKLPGYTRTEIMDSREGDWTSAYGNRYAFMRVERKGTADLWFPCLLVADDDGDKETEFFYEIGGVAAAIPKEYATGDAVICTVSPRDYTLGTRFVSRENVARYAGIVAAATEVFWNEHVFGDKPLRTEREEKKRIPLDAETLERFSALARDAAKLSLVKSRLEATDRLLRKEMQAIVRDAAWKEKCSVHDIDIPQGYVVASRGMTVLESDLQYIADKMPGAAEAMTGAIVPDPELMEAKLREIGVDDRYWCVAKPDVARVAEWCDENGVRPPLKPRVSFMVNSRSAAGKKLLDALLGEMQDDLSRLGIMPDAAKE